VERRTGGNFSRATGIEEPAGWMVPIVPRASFVSSSRTAILFAVTPGRMPVKALGWREANTGATHSFGLKVSWEKAANRADGPS
jgi:hypothetical protein